MDFHRPELATTTNLNCLSQKNSDEYICVVDNLVGLDGEELKSGKEQ
jgi:hypothetical protein